MRFGKMIYNYIINRTQSKTLFTSEEDLVPKTIENIRLITPNGIVNGGCQDPLTSDVTSEIHIEVTSKCNLRCVYCAASQPEYLGRDLPQWVLDKLYVSLIERKVELVHLNGHGETTTLRDWYKICHPFIERFPVHITSNFSKLFTADEINAFVKFQNIAISIDCADAVLTKRIRRKADLGIILGNIQAIKTRAVEIGLPIPKFIFICGVYDKNVFLLKNFAQLAIDLEIDGVTFWNYQKHSDIEGVENVYPIQTMEKKELKKALSVIDTITRQLHSRGIPTSFAGNFVETIRRQLKGENLSKSFVSTEPPSKGKTRDCLDAWRYIQVKADGQVYPCCSHSPIGQIKPNQSMEEILNGPPVKKIRTGLLTGKLDGECSSCINRPMISLDQLRRRYIREINLKTSQSLSKDGSFSGSRTHNPAIRFDNILKNGYGLGERIFLHPNVPGKPKASVTFQSFDFTNTSICDLYLYIDHPNSKPVIFGLEILKKKKVLFKAETTIDLPIKRWQVLLPQIEGDCDFKLTTNIKRKDKTNAYAWAYLSYPLFV